MTTFRIMLLTTMTIAPVILLGVVLCTSFERKLKQELSFFDVLVAMIGSDNIEVFNGVTYCGNQLDRDGQDEPLKFDTKKWFKIRIGKFVSGRGDWGGGYEYTSCAVAEVYIDNFGNMLHLCAPSPFYNSPTKEADSKLHDKVKSAVEGMNLYLETHHNVKLETKDQWLRGVLDTICQATYMGESDLWKHSMTIKKRIS